MAHSYHYKPCRYKSEALSLWLVLQQFPTSTVARHAAVVVAVPNTIQYPTNYKIKICYLRLNLEV
jgi:hypothetical protein